MRQSKLLSAQKNGGMNTLLCNNREKGIKCNHVRFRKQGPKYLDDLHMLFDKVHISGSSASCPGDISSDEASDADVDEIPKSLDNDDVKLAALKAVKRGKRKCKGVLNWCSRQG